MNSAGSGYAPVNPASHRPTVSVIIPVYNGSAFLKEAIDSVLAQTYPPLDIWVVNDGSDDGGATEAVAAAYGNRIRYFSKPNGGVASALNAGIERMSGDYFSWLSHDDAYKPDKIFNQVQFLRQRGLANAILYGGYELMDESSRTFDIIDVSRLYPADRLSVPLFPVFRGLLNGCTMLIHKSHFDRTGGFNETLRTTQDYELWFRMFRHAEIACCPGAFVRTRMHRSQTSVLSPDHERECEQLWRAMLSGVTQEEAQAMEGTAYHFYDQTARYLKLRSLYPQAQAYARELAKRELGKHAGVVPPGGRAAPLPLAMSGGGIGRLLSRLRFQIGSSGYRSTLRKIIRKLL